MLDAKPLIDSQEMFLEKCDKLRKIAISTPVVPLTMKALYLGYNQCDLRDIENGQMKTCISLDSLACEKAAVARTLSHQSSLSTPTDQLAKFESEVKSLFARSCNRITSFVTNSEWCQLVETFESDLKRCSAALTKIVGRQYNQGTDEEWKCVCAFLRLGILTSAPNAKPSNSTLVSLPNAEMRVLHHALHTSFWTAWLCRYLFEQFRTGELPSSPSSKAASRYIGDIIMSVDWDEQIDCLINDIRKSLLLLREICCARKWNLHGVGSWFVAMNFFGIRIDKNKEKHNWILDNRLAEFNSRWRPDLNIVPKTRSTTGQEPFNPYNAIDPRPKEFGSYNTGATKYRWSRNFNRGHK